MEGKRRNQVKKCTSASLVSSIIEFEYSRNFLEFKKNDFCLSDSDKFKQRTLLDILKVAGKKSDCVRKATSSNSSKENQPDQDAFKSIRSVSQSRIVASETAQETAAQQNDSSTSKKYGANHLLKDKSKHSELTDYMNFNSMLTKLDDSLSVSLRYKSETDQIYFQFKLPDSEKFFSDSRPPKISCIVCSSDTCLTTVEPAIVCNSCLKFVAQNKGKKPNRLGKLPPKSKFQ